MNELITDQLFDLSGKVALVTGGSRGIGYMIARGLVESGVKTYITARHQDELNSTEQELSSFGQCIALQSDISTIKGIESLVATISKQESHLDILVNNAGAAWGAEFDEFPEIGWDKVMDLNAKAPFFLTQKCLPLLEFNASNDDPSRVINIASINALANPKMTNYSYSASKAAVVQMTRHLAADLVSKNININAIAPGFFPSKMTAHALEDPDLSVIRSIPRARYGNAKDAAGTTIFLSSRASAWITGQTIVLDGGVIASAG